MSECGIILGENINKIIIDFIEFKFEWNEFKFGQKKPIRVTIISAFVLSELVSYI